MSEERENMTIEINYMSYGIPQTVWMYTQFSEYSIAINEHQRKRELLIINMCVLDKVMSILNKS